MIKQYSEKIDVQKEVLNALPKNNTKNINAYKKEIEKIIENYNSDKKLIIEEIKKRYTAYSQTVKDDNIDTVSSNMEDIYSKLLLINNYNSSYEKSGLDKLLYNLGHFYNNEFNKINEYIDEVLDIFDKVNVTVTFDYSYYCNLYMNKYISVHDDIDKKNIILKDFFEEIYWKCPDIISHITLNFKYLYYVNKKKFDDYYGNIVNGYINDGIKDKYSLLYNEKNKLIDNSKYLLLNSFISDSLNINDYSSDKIGKIYNSFGINLDEEVNEDIINLYHSLVEYRNYLHFKYIVDDIRILFNDKDKYKGIFNSKKKEINKLESKLFKINKKVNKAYSRGKDNKFDNIVNESITTLKGLYEELEKNYFLEKIMGLSDDSSLYDILYLASSNYNYLIELMKSKEINYSVEINEFRKFINTPNANIIPNILFNNADIDIAMIISDKYNLFGFELNKENLNIDNLDNYINDLKVLINYANMGKLGITENKIKFIKNSASIVDFNEK